ncbi:indolethylamine N-methyltransferase-like [Bombina bombina]|uniref:indolethylamine N-methyltransferase-like n=1 Tax=Bombina bombina TaxID=8345 RepID=UPI00235B2BE8|nr:indolethylamine N-methyltransferase-like [Bombina bombina]
MESSSNPSSLKHYLMEEFDPRIFSDTYCSHTSHKELLEETTLLPLRQLHKLLSPGRITGETLICIPVASIIFPLIPFLEFFNDITVLECNDVCIKELEKWRNSHDEAYDWSHASKISAELKGKGDEWKIREEQLKISIKRILKCDFTKENPTDPVTLHKVDCLYVNCSLETICKDQDEYFSCLKKISEWLKPGGHLILMAVLNGSFYMVGEHRFHLLTLDEEFIRKALRDIGYVTETIEVVERKLKYEAASYDHLAFITAVKQ